MPETPSIINHENRCIVCKHAQKADIERDYFNWAGTGRILKDYPDLTRKALLKHIAFFGLNDRRIKTRYKMYSRMFDEVAETIDALTGSDEGLPLLPEKLSNQLLEIGKHLDALDGNLKKRAPNEGKDERERYLKGMRETFEHLKATSSFTDGEIISIMETDWPGAREYLTGLASELTQ